MAPPFPPLHLLMWRRRLHAAGIIAFVVCIAVAGELWRRASEPPPASAATGMPLPGLDRDPADEAWRDAPATAFTAVDWERLGGLVMSETDQAIVRVSGDVAALDGKAVRLTGFMVPLDLGAATLDFVLVPDMGRCWFCDTPDPSRTVYARGAFGPVAAVYDRPVVAWGLLDVAVHAPAGKFHSALRMRVVRIDTL